jgi:hypothetical protein
VFHPATETKAGIKRGDEMAKQKAIQPENTRGKPFLTSEEIRVFVGVCKKLGIRMPTVLLTEGLPRVEGKICIYSDGTERPLSEVLRSHRERSEQDFQRRRRASGKS